MTKDCFSYFNVPFFACISAKIVLSVWTQSSFKEVGPRKKSLFKRSFTSLNTPLSTKKTPWQNYRMCGCSFIKAVSTLLFTPASRWNRNNSSQCLKVVSRNSKESWRRRTLSSAERLFAITHWSIAQCRPFGDTVRKVTSWFVCCPHLWVVDKFRWRAN